MARSRLVDPMAVVDAVRLTGLGVTTQAEADAAEAELRRYRDTDDARRDAPVVTGSTADGTALVSLVAALKAKGVIVDGMETVEDEVVAGSVVAETLMVNGNTELGNALSDTILVRPTTVYFENTADHYLAINPGTTARAWVMQAGNYTGSSSNVTGGNIVLSTGLGTGTGTGTLYVQTPTLAASGSTAQTAWDTRFAVNSAAVTATVPLYATSDLTVSGNTTLGNAAGDQIAVKGQLSAEYRLAAKDAPAAAIAPRTAAGSTATAAAGNYATDIAGSVTVTPQGTGIAAGIQARVTFANARGNSNNYAVLLTPNAAAAGLQVYATRNTSYFDLGANVAPTSGTAFTVHYLIIDLV